MRKAILASVFLLFTGLLLIGCSSSGRYATEIKSALKTLAELDFSLKKIKKDDDAAGVAPEIAEVSTRLLSIKTKIDESTPSDEKEKKKYLDYYSSFLDRILGNLSVEHSRVKGMKEDENESIKKIDENVKLVLDAYKTLQVTKDKKTK